MQTLGVNVALRRRRCGFVVVDIIKASDMETNRCSRRLKTLTGRARHRAFRTCQWELQSRRPKYPILRYVPSTNPSCPSLWIAAHKTTCVKARPTEGGGGPHSPCTHTHTTYAHSSPRERDRKVDMPMSQITCPGKAQARKATTSPAPTSQHVPGLVPVLVPVLVLVRPCVREYLLRACVPNTEPTAVRSAHASPSRIPPAADIYLHTWSITILGGGGGSDVLIPSLLRARPLLMPRLDSRHFTAAATAVVVVVVAAYIHSKSRGRALGARGCLFGTDDAGPS